MQVGLTLEELKNLETLDESKQLFLENYEKNMPLGVAPCTINRICWKIEEEFKKENFKFKESFDYNILKSENSSYDNLKFQQIEKIYKDYLKERKVLDSIRHSNKISDGDMNSLKNNLCLRLDRELSLICPNKEELCNILIDICYSKSSVNKRFVWEMCGDVIVSNLLRKHNNLINIPIQDKNGVFEFNGLRFSMKTVNLMELK
jgi:hypothetical protein